MRARWYSPQLGQFISPDPLGYIDSYNLYSYALFDPINNWDPYGLSGGGFGVESARDRNSWHPSEKVVQHNVVELSFDKQTRPGSLLPPELHKQSKYDLSAVSRIINESWPRSSSSDIVFVSRGDRDLPFHGHIPPRGAPTNSTPGRLHPSRLVNYARNHRWNSRVRAQRQQQVENTEWQGSNVNLKTPFPSGKHKGYQRANSDMTGGKEAALRYYTSLTGRKPVIKDAKSVSPSDSVNIGNLTVQFRANSKSGTPTVEIYNHTGKRYEKIHFNE